MKQILGIDIGGVIIDRINEGTDTSFFSDNFLNTTAVEDAFSCIQTLSEQSFKNSIYLVSKCGARTEQKTKEWLEHHNFYFATGVPKEHVLFCRERHQKAGICKELGISHFVDDRLEVLSYLIPHVPHLMLFMPREHEVQKFRKFLGNVTRVETWKQCFDSIVKTVPMKIN